MTPKVQEITPAEWDLMRIVWTKGTIHSRELIALLQLKRDWSDSTIKTLLGRLVKKGLLTVRREGRRYVYTPTVSEALAMTQTVETLFAHLCAMRKGQTITALVAKTQMTKADLDALSAVVAAKRETAPVTITCDCVPDAPCHE